MGLGTPETTVKRFRMSNLEMDRALYTPAQGRWYAIPHVIRRATRAKYGKRARYWLMETYEFPSIKHASMVENGWMGVSLAQAREIATALGFYSVDALFTKDPMPIRRRYRERQTKAQARIIRKRKARAQGLRDLFRAIFETPEHD